MAYNAIYESPTHYKAVTKISVNNPLATILVSELFIGIAFLLLLVENALQSKVWASFAYLDEVISLIFFMAAILTMLSRRDGCNVSVYEKRMIYASLIVSLFGLLSNFIYKFQAIRSAIAIDFFACNKFVLAYISCSIVLSRYNYKWVYRICVRLSKLYLIIAFICMVINQVYGIGMSTERRLGIEAFLFVFGHPSNFAASIVGILALLLADYRHNYISIMLSLLLLISTMRFKAITFSLVILLALFLYRRKSRLTIGYIIIAAVLAIAAASYQLDIYLSSETARTTLLRGSIQIANQLFPFGSGFGTYGSDVTKDAYTNLYYNLGFQYVYGLTQDNPIYLADMFYSTVIAQFGWIGLIVFSLLLLSFLADVTQESEKRRVFFWASMSIPIYLLITSTSETSLYSSYSVYLAFCLVIVLKCTKVLNRESDSNAFL